MKLTSAIQEGLVAVLCFDDTPGGGKVIRGLLSWQIFDPYYRDIAREAFDYIEKYQRVPGEHTLDIVQVLQAKQPESADIYQRVFDSLVQIKDEVNRELLFDRANAFVRYQNVRTGVGAALEALKEGDEAGVQKAEQALRKSLVTTTTLFDPGVLLTDTKRSLEFLNEEHEAFVTGIPELDELGLGPARKRLHMLIATYGKGKTWWLVHLGKHALLNRLKVLHVSLELSEAEVCSRYMQALFSLSKREGQQKITELQLDQDGHFANIVETVITQPSLRDKFIKQFLVDNLKPLTRRPRLFIRAFPTGSLTPSGLDAYLDGLEGNANFIPDLLVLDYPDLMSMGSGDDSAGFRHNLNRLFVDIRGIAVKRNIAIACVTQSNSAGEDAKIVKGKNASEAYGKMGTVDICFTYNQTPAEHELGLARLFVDKGRVERDKFSVLLSQCYGLGQFCLSSAKMAPNYFSVVDNAGEGDL